MAQDWQSTLRAGGWYHDEANDGLALQVWKCRNGRGGEINVTPGGVIRFMEGEVQLLQRVSATMDQPVSFPGKDPKEWVHWVAG